MMLKTPYLRNTLAGILLIVAVIFLFWYLNEEPDSIRQLKKLKKNPRPVREIDAAALSSIVYKLNEEGGRRIEGELTFEQKIALIRQRWGKNIDNNYIQIKMLEELIRLCQKEQPNDWVACANELSAAAFPGLAGHLFNQLESLLRYNAWLAENKEKLDQMSRAERNKLLAERRAAFFGKENADIIFAAEIKAENIRGVLEELKNAPNLSVDQKLNQYKSALQENYGELSKAYLERHQQEMVHSFLSVVQDDLRKLDPVQQKAALRNIRSEMGMDAAALERWDILDVEREQRWRAGKEYLAARESLINQFKGNPPETALHDLRKKYYGAEAETVAIEEAAGFFRHQGEQRLGID